MLIAQAPLRVSLFGGGSDLPAFLENNEGAVLSFAIDRRVFIVGHPFTHRHGVLLKYSKTEDVQHPGDLQHPIARVVLERYGVNDIDMAVMSDVPAGTGMGSSSAFTVAFLAFVRHFVGIQSTPSDLAREACEIEIEELGEPIGYQDQWAAALGGVNVLRFTGSSVTVESVGLAANEVWRLEENLHLVPVGRPRSASSLLANQASAMTKGSKPESLVRSMVALVDEGVEALRSDMDALGPLLDQAWQLKREVSSGVATQQVDAMYSEGRNVGATGGKLLGAGGSGYLAFYVPEAHHRRFSEAFPNRLRFHVSAQGAGVVHQS